jgi:chromosome segregation ATPase
MLAAPITAVTPIQKVVQMLGEMAAKGKEEKNIEEVEFAKFKTWCEDVISDKTKQIAEAADKIEQLNADILKAESDAKVLGEEIAAQTADVATWEADMENATAIRDKEKADYDAAHADYSESIDAIERAIAVLKQRAADIPQSLLQLSKSDLIPAKARAIVASMMQVQESSESTNNLGAPEANAYEFQSGGVVAMLEKLLHKFEDELFALEKAEMNANANYEMLMQKLTALVRDAKDAIAKKTAEKASRLEFAAEAKGELEITSASKAEDEKTLSDTLAECHAKSDEFEKNQNTRADEVKAIEKATEILMSPAVAGNAAKHLPTLAQVSLIQVRELGSGSGRAAAAAFLQRQAKSLGSRYLALAAARMSADPFKKVKKMIKDLIVKLMEEANAEAEHKGFCDTELATNKQTRDNLSADVDELTANIEEKTALISQLTTAIKELSDAIAEIKKQQAEATALRAEEKEKNLATIADAQAGTTAVEMAIKVLKDFYEGAAEASLLQGGAGIESAMHSAQRNRAPYKGQQDESTGVLGMLEVILSDFTRLETETSSAEDAAQAEYERFMAEATERHDCC